MDFKIQAGELDRQVVLQSSTTTKSSVGHLVHTWSTVDTVWARVREKAGEEKQQGRDVVHKRRLEVIIRYYTGLQNTWRLQYQGVNFQILGAPVELNRRQWMQITCEQIGETTSA